MSGSEAVLDIHADRAAGRPEREGQVILRDGTPMSYGDAGTGPVVLAVHGWAASRIFFDGLSGRLSDGFRFMAPDLRAHGTTPAGQLPLSIETLADDLADLIETLDLSKIVLVGWSMGAMVAWSMIDRHGADRIAGLVVEDMTPRILNDADWSLGMSSGMNASGSARAIDLMRADWSGYAATFAPRMFARDRRRDAPDMVAEATAELSRRNGDAMAEIWGSMAAQDMRAALSGITLPVLVAHGARSEAYGPETSRYLADTLPQADIETFARSGHAPHLEQPEEFAHAVQTFARRVQAGAIHQQNIEGSISS